MKSFPWIRILRIVSLCHPPSLSSTSGVPSATRPTIGQFDRAQTIEARVAAIDMMMPAALIKDRSSPAIDVSVSPPAV